MADAIEKRRGGSIAKEKGLIMMEAEHERDSIQGKTDR